ncbi:MAG: diguanylate cyclase [Syntrophaceae bacterium]|jgi:GGDEF domain-containing protein|nr:diguanylate cyclase [Syntrophaceae bacterium]HQM44516.1 diguanylate cyclase [Smithellaceae bacterium]
MKTVVVVCKDVILNNVFERSLKDRYQVAVFNNMPSALDYIYNSIPNLLVINIADDAVGVHVLNDLKSDPMFNHLPVLAVLPENFNIADWGDLQAEDYVRRSQIETEFLARVNLSILRSEKIVEINPLTRLPGNISINKEIQERIDNQKEFAFGYADLDHFKPFNDRYGFSRGDEVIKMTGRIVLGVVKSLQPQGSFVGHVGGDDFVFIIDTALMEDAASEIVRAFDSLIPGMYDPDDLKRGFIQSFDRTGRASQFPMMGISIGIAETHNRTFTHYGEITQIAADMKKFAKRFTGSCYKTDQRLEGGKILSA